MMCYEGEIVWEGVAKLILYLLYETNKWLLLSFVLLHILLEFGFRYLLQDILWNFPGYEEKEGIIYFKTDSIGNLSQNMQPRTVITTQTNTEVMMHHNDPISPPFIHYRQKDTFVSQYLGGQNINITQTVHTVCCYNEDSEGTLSQVEHEVEDGDYSEFCNAENCSLIPDVEVRNDKDVLQQLEEEEICDDESWQECEEEEKADEANLQQCTDEKGGDEVDLSIPEEELRGDEVSMQQSEVEVKADEDKLQQPEKEEPNLLYSEEIVRADDVNVQHTKEEIRIDEANLQQEVIGDEAILQQSEESVRSDQVNLLHNKENVTANEASTQKPDELMQTNEADVQQPKEKVKSDQTTLVQCKEEVSADETNFEQPEEEVIPDEDKLQHPEKEVNADETNFQQPQVEAEIDETNFYQNEKAIRTNETSLLKPEEKLVDGSKSDLNGLSDHGNFMNQNLFNTSDHNNIAITQPPQGKLSKGNNHYYRHTTIELEGLITEIKEEPLEVSFGEICDPEAFSQPFEKDINNKMESETHVHSKIDISRSSMDKISNKIDQYIQHTNINESEGLVPEIKEEYVTNLQPSDPEPYIRMSEKELQDENKFDCHDHNKKDFHDPDKKITQIKEEETEVSENDPACLYGHNIYISQWVQGTVHNTNGLLEIKHEENMDIVVHPVEEMMDSKEDSCNSDNSQSLNKSRKKRHNKR